MDIFSAVVTLFLIMDPLGNIPVFLSILKQVAPERPFLMYFCPGAGHAPHQVPKEWADRYRAEGQAGMADRSVLITGGTGGLGRAVTAAFVKTGWRVVLPVRLPVQLPVQGDGRVDGADAGPRQQRGEGDDRRTCERGLDLDRADDAAHQQEGRARQRDHVGAQLVPDEGGDDGGKHRQREHLIEGHRSKPLFTAPSMRQAAPIGHHHAPDRITDALCYGCVS